METLRALRDHLASIELDIDRSILSIEKGLASLGADSDEAGDNEALDDFYPDSEIEEVPEEEGMQPRPRSSSLAADTIGGPMYMQNAPQRRGQ